MAVVEHHPPAGLVGQVDGKKVSGQGVKSPQDRVFGVHHQLLLVLRPPDPGVKTLGADETEAETAVEAEAPDEGAVRLEKRDIIKVLEDGQFPLGSEDDLRGGLKIAGTLSFPAELRQETALGSVLEDGMFHPVEQVEIEMVVLADRNDRSEKHLLPADLQPGTEFNPDGFFQTERWTEDDEH